ncbi:cell division cycle-associated protein 4-like [Conger conger]|nr:cell division cycle-associated protein 4-like [Conger conger]XP_061099889.1 cell division cycle-associated protein 4-like [Conger conger]
MFPKGTKRKCLDGGGGDEEAASASVKTASYSLQRQCLLDMSLIKLQLCHMLAEPNLCRSVLIANTVRQIQEEMTRDGSWQIMTEALSAGQGLSERLVASEILCRPAAGSKGEEEPEPFTAAGGRQEEEVEAEEEEVAEETLRVVAAEADSAYVPEAADPCWEAGVGVKGESEDEDADDEGCCSGEGEGEEEERSAEGTKAAEQVYGTFEIKSPAPSPDPALEELFSDVDASYYDLDTMLTGMQAAPKVGPYDLLENLSSHGPSATCRTDLNELDHIMEIIVGS